MSKYLLAPNSSVCETAGHAVFLDLKRDRYVAVAPKDMRTLRASVYGWPPCSADAATDIGSRHSLEILNELVDEGILTTNIRTGRKVEFPCLETPIRSLSAMPLQAPISAGDRWRFKLACSMAKIMLRTLPFRWTVHRVRRRKQRRSHAFAAPDMRQLQRLTAIHQELQPSYYSGQDACLRNSLTLLEFLALHDIYPSWVFGVRLQPFMAHSWVQYKSTALGDVSEFVAKFEPILVI